MKELLVSIAVIIAIIATVIGNIFPQYDTICGWVMVSALITCACVIAFYDDETV